MDCSVLWVRMGTDELYWEHLGCLFRPQSWFHGWREQLLCSTIEISIQCDWLHLHYDVYEILELGMDINYLWSGHSTFAINSHQTYFPKLWPDSQTLRWQIIESTQIIRIWLTILFRIFAISSGVSVPLNLCSCKCSAAAAPVRNSSLSTNPGRRARR